MHVHRSTDTETASIPISLLRDQTLSWAARGLLLDLLARETGDPNPTITGLREEARSESAGRSEGKTTISNLLKELERHGYLLRRHTLYGAARDDSTFEVYDTPQEFEEEPESGLPMHKPSIDVHHKGEVVYAIGEPGGHLVKIGTTANLSLRFRNLQSSSPARLDVLWFGPGSFELEAKLHQRFSMWRQHGEWFHFGELGDPAELVPAAAKELSSDLVRD